VELSALHELYTAQAPHHQRIKSYLWPFCLRAVYTRRSRCFNDLCAESTRFVCTMGASGVINFLGFLSSVQLRFLG
jgi:hypothetical protein